MSPVLEDIPRRKLLLFGGSALILSRRLYFLKTRPQTLQNMAVGSGSISNLTVGSGFRSPKEINGSATLLKSTQYQTLLFLPETSLYNPVLWRACNLTSFSPCLTGPVDYPFASRHKGPGFKSSGGYLCETGILLLALSRYSTLLLLHDKGTIKRD
jgi:hypothetical protein